MRCLKRNSTPFWYCLYSSASEMTDEYGNSTGEMDRIYANAVMMNANISAATGQAQTEMFGNLDSYDKVIVTDDLNCQIDEHTVLFVDKEPEYPVITPSASASTSEVQYDTAHPKYDYIVKRVAKSLNSVSIAIRKVDVE